MSFSNVSTVPIELLPGIGKRTAKALRALDIRTIGEFKRTPEKVLVELFGPSIRSLHGYVRTGRYEQTQKSFSTKPTHKRTFGRRVRLAANMLAML